MKKLSSTVLSFFFLMSAGVVAAPSVSAATAAPTRFPANNATGVNPDTHLVLTFAGAPTLGSAGQIRIYDASNNQLVDTLDLSIPPSPRGGAAATTAVTLGAGADNGIPYVYGDGVTTNTTTVVGVGAAPATPPPPSQLTYIGNFPEPFHFYPVIINDNIATIYPHNHKLDYNKTYYVQIDPSVLTMADGSFTGITGNTGWTFSTKKTPPAAGTARLTVAADGSGDFNTVQGAVDFVPDKNPNRVTIFIKNGIYEEIVYFRNKTNITFLGESRDDVVICYANSETFNGVQPGTRTNEVPGTYPYHRASFQADNSSGIQIVNLTLHNLSTGGQAESLLLMGGKNIVSNVNLMSRTDTLQFNDSVYITDTYIEGTNDFVWGRGASFFNNTTIHGLTPQGPFIWVRGTSASHGFVFQNCRFETMGSGQTIIARNPTNGTKSYPYSEVIFLNCAFGDPNPVAFTLGGDTSTMHYWEYNTTNISDGKPADLSGRNPAAKQLTMAADAKTIADYSNPTFVLGGWTPTMAPIILNQPASISADTGKAAAFSVTAAAIPAATYQWQFNGAPLKEGNGVSGAATANLTLASVQSSNAGKYSVVVTNGSGSATSSTATLTIGAAGK